MEEALFFELLLLTDFAPLFPTDLFVETRFEVPLEDWVLRDPTFLLALCDEPARPVVLLFPADRAPFFVTLLDEEDFDLPPALFFEALVDLLLSATLFLTDRF